MAARMGKQDMPPPGGYGPIQISRIPLREVVNWKWTLAGFTVMTIGSWIIMKRSLHASHRLEVERKSADLAITPLLVAEKDRALLLHMRNMRDYETKLMGDFPRWEVGTLFGEPVYHSLPKDSFIKPLDEEILNNTSFTGDAYYHYIPHIL